MITCEPASVLSVNYNHMPRHSSNLQLMLHYAYFIRPCQVFVALGRVVHLILITCHLVSFLMIEIKHGHLWLHSYISSFYCI